MPTFTVKKKPAQTRREPVVTIIRPAKKEPVKTTRKPPVTVRPKVRTGGKIIDLDILPAKKNGTKSAAKVKKKPQPKFNPILSVQPKKTVPPRSIYGKHPDPAPPHGTVVFKPAKKVVEILEAPASISYAVAPDTFKCPSVKVGDGVKLGILNYERFSENLIAQVIAIKGKKIIGNIRDTVFWHRDHGLKCGSRVEFERDNVLRHISQPRWVDDRHFERRSKHEQD